MERQNRQKPLRLTAVCSSNPAEKLRWRVTNLTPDPINFTYDVVGTAQSGSGMVPGGIGTRVHFFTQRVGGPNTTRLRVDGQQVDVKASGFKQCPLITVKVPVTLANQTVQVNMDSAVTLPEPALEVKEIKKNLKITQCLLLQEPISASNNVYNFVNNTAPLFIKGFVRKNITYSTRSCSNAEGVCGDIRHCTVDVPFSCTTQITLGPTPQQLPLHNTVNEFEYFRREKLPKSDFAEKDKLLSGDFSEFNQVSEEFFTELPYCELISSRIVEFDEFLNRMRPKGDIPFEEREFKQIEEKMVLFITLKVLQTQQVSFFEFD